MVVKIDLEKAYDRVDWQFLDNVLRSVGFQPRLRQVIRSCLESSSLSVVWNGTRLEPFTPQRGLRQGDPLSPYLFVLCMEVLGHHIANAVDQKQWKPVQVGKKGIRLSHLVFADDLLLFAEASNAQATIIHEVLHRFCKESGQKVNIAKSKVWYSSNTSRHLIHSISQHFGMITTTYLGKYLGLPLIHDRLRSQHFNYLVDKVHAKLGGWKGKLLSQAARLLLIQTVSATIPYYAMNVCHLPRRTLDALERANRNFLWGIVTLDLQSMK